MVEHPAARALTGYLLVRGGVQQVAYARALENLTGSDMTKLFPSPRIPTDKIPECKPHIKRGEHLKLYGPHPVFAPGPEPKEIEEIAQKLREAAGLPKEPTGEVAN
jgi:Mn-containing catalase